MSDNRSHFQEELPFNPLPPVVVALALVIIGIELLFQAGAKGLIGGPEAIGWRVAAFERFGFFDSVFSAMLEQGRWPLEHVIRSLSYSMIHVSFMQAIMVVVFILALGKMVAETFGSLAIVVIFAVSAIVGSFTYGVVLTTKVPLLGGYPGAYGLIGAYTLILWIGLGAMHEKQSRAFTLIGFLMGIQLIFAVFFNGDPTWVADIAGFVAGFFVTLIFVPGAIPRLFERLRRR